MKHSLNALSLAVAAMTYSLPVVAALEPVTQTYVAIAQSAYEDSLVSARKLRQAIGAFLDAPSVRGDRKVRINGADQVLT